MSTDLKRLRVALFGSPAFALETLEGLAREHELVMVVSQPDKPAGRGLNVRASAVAARARELGLELWQPTRLRSDAEFLAGLADADLDVAVTAAYGRILPEAVLQAPRHGVLNVHASLLPAYRGAAPVQWAVIKGERETGVTIMQTEAGLDTGPIRLQRRVTIPATETAPALLERLATVGAEALLEALRLLAAGDLPATPQDDAAATLAPLLVPQDGHLRWSDPATDVWNRFRGVSGWPGTSFEHAGTRVKVTAMAPVVESPNAESLNAGSPWVAGSPAAGSPPPGTVLELDGESITVATGAGAGERSGAVRLERLKPAGGREMSAGAWANGRRLKVGEQLG